MISKNLSLKIKRIKTPDFSPNGSVSLQTNINKIIKLLDFHKHVCWSRKVVIFPIVFSQRQDYIGCKYNLC
jgi:hypothetical protein